MINKAETFDSHNSKKYAILRDKGPKEIDKFLASKMQTYSTLEQIALLSNTGRLNFYYEVMGKARLEGHSWRAISEAATGKSDALAGQHLYHVYLSFCKNNNIEPVKIRGSKK